MERRVRGAALTAAVSVGLSSLVPVSLGSVSAYADVAASLRVETTVDRVDLGWTGVSVGDPLVIDVDFDPTTPDANPSPTYGVYPASILGATVSVNGTAVIEATGGGHSLVNDSVLGTGEVYDQYTMSFTGVTSPISPVPPWNMSVGLFVQGATAPDALADDALTAAPPDLSRFTNARFSVSFQDMSDCEEWEVFPDCGRVRYIFATVDRILGGSADADGDSVADSIGVVDGTGSPIPGAFDDGEGTTGQILTGTGLLVEDAPAPDGVRVTTTEPATLSVCSGFTLALTAGSDVIITCGSVTARVTAGTTTIGIGTGVVTVPQGGDATIDRLASGDYVVTNNGTEPVDVTRGGITSSLAPGTVGYSAPQGKQDCKQGGWVDYGIFANQGSCVSYVNHH